MQHNHDKPSSQLEILPSEVLLIIGSYLDILSTAHLRKSSTYLHKRIPEKEMNLAQHLEINRYIYRIAYVITVAACDNPNLVQQTRISLSDALHSIKKYRGDEIYCLINQNDLDTEIESAANIEMRGGRGRARTQRGRPNLFLDEMLGDTSPKNILDTIKENTETETAFLFSNTGKCYEFKKLSNGTWKCTPSEYSLLENEMKIIKNLAGSDGRLRMASKSVSKRDATTIEKIIKKAHNKDVNLADSKQLIEKTKMLVGLCAAFLIIALLRKSKDRVEDHPYSAWGDEHKKYLEQYSKQDRSFVEFLSDRILKGEIPFSMDLLDSSLMKFIFKDCDDRFEKKFKKDCQPFQELLYLCGVKDVKEFEETSKPASQPK